MKYYTSKTIEAPDMATAREKIETALKTEGFGILSVIDLQATLKAKLNKDYLPHIILGACNPVYADEVLGIEPQVSTLLPCNVTLRQLENGKYEVAMISPAAAMQAVGNPKIEIFAEEVQKKLDRVLDLV